MTDRTIREWNIKRADGRMVQFRGCKDKHVGRAAIYKTVGGNRVFQYAPNGNGIGLKVIKLPELDHEAISVIEKHASPDEFARLADYIAKDGSVIFID